MTSSFVPSPSSKLACSNEIAVSPSPEANAATNIPETTIGLEKPQLRKYIEIGLSYGIIDVALFYGHFACTKYPDDVTFKHALSDAYSRKGCNEAVINLLSSEKDIKSIGLYCQACISLSRPDLAMKKLQCITISQSCNHLEPHEASIYYYYYSILMKMLGHGSTKEVELSQVASSTFFPPMGPVISHGSFSSSPSSQKYHTASSLFFPRPFDAVSNSYNMLCLPTDGEFRQPSYHQHPFILLALARLCHHNGRLSSALHYYNQLYLQYPYFQDGISEYSSLLWQLKDKPTLTSLAHRLLSRSFSQRLAPSTWITVANAVSLHGDHPSALKALQRASMLDPSQAYVYSLMGQEYLSLDSISDASQCFNKAISLNPERQYEAYVGLANIEIRYERYKEARSLMEKALKIQPNNAQLQILYEKIISIASSHHR